VPSTPTQPYAFATDTDGECTDTDGECTDTDGECSDAAAERNNSACAGFACIRQAINSTIVN